MVKKYTNNEGISLLMSVFLADDRYNHDPRDNVISVTSLMKSTRQIILNIRLKPGEGLTDISGLLASRLGTSIHESIEKAWVENYMSALAALGHPPRMIDQININPPVPTEGIDLYLEIRSEKAMGKWIISGESDAILDGTIRDIKSTKVWSYTSGSNKHKYILQLSLYRWLNQEKVTEDTGYIDYLFMDWNKLKSTYEEGYPAHPVLEQALPLISVPETERYVINKLEDIEEYYSKAESELPLCSDEDLWIRASEFKYYAKPDAKRATKNFKDNKAGAYMHLQIKGVGEVREVKGKAMACNYCSGKAICTQYAALKAAAQI